jgi:hypothetical protein
VVQRLSIAESGQFFLAKSSPLLLVGPQFLSLTKPCGINVIDPVVVEEVALLVHCPMAGGPIL